MERGADSGQWAQPRLVIGNNGSVGIKRRTGAGKGNRQTRGPQDSDCVGYQRLSTELYQRLVPAHAA